MRALVVCPGRGSYERASLGSLRARSAAVNELLDTCDAYRAARNLPNVRELDAADTFRASWHVAGEHASLLTFAATMADWQELDPSLEVVGVVGNSMGWYTALVVSGALSLADGIRLVDTLGGYQRENIIGGQLLYPLTTADWAPSAALREVVDAALREALAAGHVAEWSIHLGGYAVLGADRGGVKYLLERLPSERRGSRTFPLQLPLHSAFHTSLMAETSERARHELSDLRFGPPRCPLIDGRGVVFRPRWAEPRELAAYTLGHQIVKPFDFTTGVRTALRHCGPDVVICLGPGNPLGGTVARILLEEGWNGMTDRATFEAASRERARVVSLGAAPS